MEDNCLTKIQGGGAFLLRTQSFGRDLVFIVLVGQGILSREGIFFIIDALPFKVHSQQVHPAYHQMYGIPISKHAQIQFKVSKLFMEGMDAF